MMSPSVTKRATAMVLAIIGFISTIAVARFVTEGDIIE